MQHGLVAEHHGRFLFVLRQVFPNPLRQVACLSVSRRRFDEGYFFRMVQVVEQGRRQFRGEILQVAADKLACLVRMLVQVEGIVVPVEQGLSCLVQFAEQGLFHLIQHVESHEHIFVVGKLLHVHGLRHLAVEHSFVGDALLAEQFLVLRIDVAQHVPQ